MRKIIIGGIGLLLALGAVWYFFLKAYDYSITFKAPTPPGAVYHKVLIWNKNSTEIKTKEPYKELVEVKKIGGKPIELRWEFISTTDTTTLVRANIKTLENNLKERWNLVFGKTYLQSATEKDIRGLKESLERDLEKFKISVEGEAIAPETTCACISLENNLEKKALEMMGSINYLADYISENELEMAAKPRIHVTEWNVLTNEIKFDFCFPITRMSNLPKHPRVFIKKIPSQKALKAIFNGHYGISQLAWYSLLNYAERRDIEVSHSPLEIFNVNPELGGDSRYWEAEIYLPIK